MLNCRKNKRHNQIIHKKYNQIQYWSKHYGKAPHSIISKGKSPVKQRKDRKKFKSQRKRKKIHKQMAYDFDDFLFRNQCEIYNNYHTPKIQYEYKYIHPNHKDEYNINKTYYDYYFNHETDHIYNNYHNWISSYLCYWPPEDPFQMKYNEDSLRNRFDYIYSHYLRWKGQLSRWRYELEDKYKPTYEQYLSHIPQHMQFSYNMNKFKSQIKQSLNRIIFDKCYAPSMETDNNKHKILIKVLADILNVHYALCGDCKDCKRRLKLMGYLSDRIASFCISDIKPMIYQVLNEIKQNYNQTAITFTANAKLEDNHTAIQIFSDSQI